MLEKQIIEIETEKSWKIIQGELYNGSIGKIYQQTEALRQQELSKLFTSLEGLGDAERKAIEMMTKSLTQKLLHKPISTAKSCAREEDYEHLGFLLDAMTLNSEDKS